MLLLARYEENMILCFMYAATVYFYTCNLKKIDKLKFWEYLPHIENVRNFFYSKNLQGLIP